MTRRLVYALDLQNDPMLIEEYERWHQAGRIWPEIVQSLRAAGIDEAEIYRTGNRLVLILDVPLEFDPAAKAAADATDARVQAWETLMWKYQQALPWAQPGQKWVPMHRIFSLTDLSIPPRPGTRAV
ncbi:MAG: L-rhamnose mutarotase [Sinobacteraceae bacterium]|nr:L-rhamnose mutarotase [Nevskiaceae bacterium]